MRTLGLLLRTEFLSLVGSYNKKGKTSVIVAASVLILVGLFMVGMFAIIGGSTAFMLVEKNLDEFAIYLSLSLSMIIALMFGVTNSTRDARSNDTDMLLAMPIPKSSIVISKLLGMYLLDVLCALVMMVPATLIVVFVGEHPFSLFIRGLLFSFLIPAIPLFISLLVSALIGFLRKATKFGQIASTLLSMAVLLLYMFVVPNISTYADSLTITAAESVTKMKQILPFYWITEAIYSGDLLCVVLTLLMTLIPLALAVYIHARGLNGVDFHADNSKKERSYKSSSVRKAVFSMEFRRYFSSTNYIMNTLFGTVFLLGITVMLAFKGLGDIPILSEISVDGESVDLISKITAPGWAAVWALFINFFGAITYTTPPSVSVEGKRIWLSKTLPIPTKDILFAKVLVSVLIFQPISAACCIALAIISKSGILSCLISIVITCLFQLLASLIGLIFGLIFAKLDWTNEAQVIKSGFAVVMSMLVNLGLALLVAGLMVGGLLIGKVELTYAFLGGTIILLAGLSVGAYAIITHYGVRKYESLNG